LPYSGFQVIFNRAIRKSYNKLRTKVGLSTLNKNVGETMVLQEIVVIDRDILGGTPVFKGTRVPIKNLLDYLEGGYDIDEFLDHFPAVKKEQVIRFLKISVKEYLTTHENIA
jgi:uncharacterized protein (DUF433 family)